MMKKKKLFIVLCGRICPFMTSKGFLRAIKKHVDKKISLFLNAIAFEKVFSIVTVKGFSTIGK